MDEEKSETGARFIVFLRVIYLARTERCIVAVEEDSSCPCGKMYRPCTRVLVDHAAEGFEGLAG